MGAPSGYLKSFALSFLFFLFFSILHFLFFFFFLSLSLGAPLASWTLSTHDTQSLRHCQVSISNVVKEEEDCGFSTPNMFLMEISQHKSFCMYVETVMYLMLWLQTGFSTKHMTRYIPLFYHCLPQSEYLETLLF